MNKVLRDLTVSLVVPWKLEFWGGGEKLAVEISNYLYDKGMDVEVIGDSDFNAIERVSKNFIHNLLRVTYKLFDYENTGLFHTRLNQKMPDPGIFLENQIVLFFIRRLPTRGYIRKLEIRGLKSIFLIHGLSLEGFNIKNLFFSLYSLYTKFILIVNKRTYTNSHMIFQVLTNQFKNTMIQFGYNQNRIHLVENGVRTNFLLDRNDTKFNVLFVGRLNNLQKGIKRLVKVAKFIERSKFDITFIVAGSGESEHLVKNSKLKNMEFLGQIDESDKFTLLRRSNLSIITSSAEPFSLFAIESLNAGLPIVSTPSSGPIHIISKNEKFGVIAGFSPKKISLEVIRYYNLWNTDKTKYFKNKEIISKTSEKMFNPENMLYKYYKMVLDSGRRD